MALTGIENNYNAYESAYAVQKNGVKKTETKEKQTEIAKSNANRTASDYGSYLQKTYDCVKDGKVAISSAYLGKCASDPEEAKKLEENLSLFKDIYDEGYKSAQRAAAANGGKLVSYSENWSIDDNGNISAVVHTTVRTESPNKSKASGQADWLKKLQEKKKEERLAEKKRAEKRQAKRKQEEHLAEMRAEKKAESENLQSRDITVVSNNARDLTEKMVEAIAHPNHDALSETAGLDFKI